MTATDPLPAPPAGPPAGPQGGTPSAPRRVLIVRLSHLGDIAQALPVLHAVRERWPHAEVGWAIQPEFAGFVAPLARVFPFDRSGGAGAWKAIYKELKAWRPDLILDAQGNWKSAVTARIARRASRGARSVAFARDAWQEPLAASILRPELVRSAGCAHLVDRCIALSEYATEGAVTPRLDPDLDEKERAAGFARLAELTGARAPVILHPGAAGDPRSWPKERFAQLARRLMAGGADVAILTGPGEARIGEVLREAIPRAGHIVGQRGVRALAALLFAARDRGGQIVVGDSGPAHIAASVGLPVVFLAGPEDPLRTGPWPTVAHAGTPHRLALPPADLGVADWRPRSIDTIGVDDVMRALDP